MQMTRLLTTDTERNLKEILDKVVKENKTQNEDLHYLLQPSTKLN